MRIAVVTDAWEPQVNGVVNTLKATVACLRSMDHEVLTVTPEELRTFACPTYPDIRLAYKPYGKVASRLASFAPAASFQNVPFVWSIWSYRSVLCSQWGGQQTLMAYGYAPTTAGKYVSLSYTNGQ